MKKFNNILSVWAKELHQALSDNGVLVFFFVVPLLYPLLYAYLYNNEQVHEVPIVVVDNDNSTISREFLRKVDASADVKIVGHCADLNEAVEEIHRHKAYGLVYIPSDFNKNLSEGQQAIVELYADMSGMLYYKAVLSSCTEVSLAMNKDIKTQRLGGATKEQAEVFAYPIEYKSVPMFNTQNGFATFLIPAVLMLVIQQTLVLGVGMLAGDENERKKTTHLMHRHLIGKSPMEILLGKSSAYLVIYAFVAVYVACLVPRWFHLIQIWQWRDLLAFMVPYLLACVFFSITVSVLAQDREMFIIMFVFMSIPMLFMSGISWPTSAMPHFWRWISWLFPSTFGINGFVRIGSMGALLKDVRPELIGLWTQTAVYFATSLITYKYKYGKEPLTDKAVNLSGTE